MNGNRETANIWFWAFTLHRLPIRILKSRYFLQDSFLTYWNRLIGCRLGGHKTKLLVGENTTEYDFCFKCYRQIGETRVVTTRELYETLSRSYIPSHKIRGG